MTGKQLKNSILQWAIQGKLVPQDPNDEPASVLLERIREEKKRLIKEGKIKKDKNETIIYRGEDNSYYEKVLSTGEVKCIDDEIPFEIPDSWQWERWGNISHSIQYGYNAPAETNGDVRMVRISDIQNGDVQWETVPFCHINETDIENYLLQENDILFARTGGTVGKSFLVRKTPYPAIYAGYLIRTRYSCFLSPNYLKFFMESQLYWEQLRNGTIATAQPNCNGKTLSKMIVPIPPHNEQIRITDKLKEVLSQVCRYGLAQDRLDNLNFQIQASLKKSILQEAIQGRLVPQIPEEGTAQELLEQIRQEKARLVKEGKLKKSALSDSTIFRGDDNKYYEQVGSQVYVIEEDIPFDIPDSWCWMRLGCLVYCETGLAYSKDNLNDKSGSMIRVLRGGNIEEGRWSVKDDDVMIASKYVREELLLKRGTFITPAVTSLERMAKTALIETDLHDTVAGGFVLMLKPFLKYDAILEYLNLLFQTSYYKQYCVSITNKSGQAFYNLSRQKLMQCMIPIAPIKEMIRIVTKYESLDL